MTSLEDDARGAYVRRIAQETQRYTEEILLDNQNLRMQMVVLSHEKGLLEERLREAQDALDRHREAQQQAELSVERIRRESEGFAAQYRDLEAQNSNLANLYVASYQLHGTLDQQDVFRIIQEIVANLVGCEEVAIFEADAAATALRLVASTGIERTRYELVARGHGLIGRAFETGEIWVTGDDDGAEAAVPGEPALSACIPLKLDGRVSGALALFRLLPQKTGIDGLDRELFALLATHAATALYCTALHARLAGGVRE
jgi:hypothetical protein